MINFKYSEFINSDVARKNGINNEPSKDLFDNMLLTVVMMQKVRELLKVPIVISSGYRNPQLNKLVGGAKYSKHLEFLAVDFAPKNGFTIKEAYEKIIESDITYDKVILESKARKDGSISEWIHIQFSKTPRVIFLEKRV